MLADCSPGHGQGASSVVSYQGLRDFFAGDEGVGQVVGDEAASPRLAISGAGRIALTPEMDAELAFSVSDIHLPAHQIGPPPATPSRRALHVVRRCRGVRSHRQRLRHDLGPPCRARRQHAVIEQQIHTGPQQTAATIYRLPMLAQGIQGRAK